MGARSGFSIEVIAMRRTRVILLIAAVGVFIQGSGVHQLPAAGNEGGFQTSSWALIWDDVGHLALAVDGERNICIVGICCKEVDLDPTAGEFLYAPSKPWSWVGGYALKISTSGELLWARTFEASEVTSPSDVAVDSAGGVYIAGRFEGTLSFDGQPSVVAPEWDVEDPCLFKLDSSGELEWMYSVHGEDTGGSQGSLVAVDTQDNVYLAGTYGGYPRFEQTTPPLSWPDWRVLSSTTNAFLVKLDAQANVKWARKWAGGHTVSLGGMAVDRRGSVCVTGAAIPYLGATWFFEEHGEVDFEFELGSFLIRFDTYGFPLCTDSLHSAFGSPSKVAFDASGELYIAGSRRSGLGLYLDEAQESAGALDVGTLYIAHYTRDLGFQVIESLDGENESRASGLAVDSQGVDSQGNVYVSGSFWAEADLDPGIDEDWHRGGPYWNHFVIRLNSGLGYMGSFMWMVSERSYGLEPTACDVAVDPDGNVYVISGCSTDSTIRLTRDFAWEGELGDHSRVLFKLSPDVFR